MGLQISFEELQIMAARHGLAVFGVATPEFLEADAERLSMWQRRGFSGEMSYMLRDPNLLASPEGLLEGCRSILSFAIPYATGPHPALQPGYGRVARYAWGKDYHEVLPAALAALCAELAIRCGPESRFRYFTDAIPLLERAVAVRAGIGIIGRNTLLIRPGTGSFQFLAEVLTTVEIVERPPPQPPGKGCGTCSRCKPGCPTGALDGEYSLDARRCISYLSIEKRGALSHSERQMLGEWLFGCDLCQDICPFNHRALRGRTPRAREEFDSKEGVGALLELSSVLSIRTNRLFEDRFRGTPLLRARRAGLLRNAAVVAANTRAVVVLNALIEAASEDRSPIVRRHCAWAIRMLDPDLTGAERVRARTVLERLLLDPDPEVATEARG